MENERYRNYKIPKIATDDYSKNAVDERLQWLEQIKELKFKHIRSFSERTEKMQGNIENLIGVCNVPLGITGPVLVNGDYAKGYYFVPMATTEGALVLDYQMGIRMMTSSGGARVKLINDFVHVDPFFYVNNLDEALDLISWIKLNIEKIKEIVSTTTRHGKLISIDPFLLQRRVVLKMSYQTADAQGLNMINRATEAVCNYIKESKSYEYGLRSHYSSIKSVSHSNIHCGQAKSLFAETFIKNNILKKFFNVTAEQVEKYFISSLLAGVASGRVGNPAHIANAITAIFIACGQDVADISVSHIGMSGCEVTEEGDLYVSCYLPNLFVGTVGGGTSLGSQQECLRIMDCYGAGCASKFAEIITAVVLAGEISVLAALVSGNYVNAHEKYGRNRPEFKDTL